jgi:hypothetical protein
LIKRVGEDLLASAESQRLWWPGSTVAAPGVANSHANLFCYLGPGLALVAQLEDLLCGGEVGGSAAPHGDIGVMKLLAYGGPSNAKLCTDLAQAPALAYNPAARSTDGAAEAVTIGSCSGVMGPSGRWRVPRPSPQILAKPNPGRRRREFCRNGLTIVIGTVWMHSSATEGEGKMPARFRSAARTALLEVSPSHDQFPARSPVRW